MATTAQSSLRRQRALELLEQVDSRIDLDTYQANCRSDNVNGSRLREPSSINLRSSLRRTDRQLGQPERAGGHRPPIAASPIVQHDARLGDP